MDASEKMVSAMGAAQVNAAEVRKMILCAQTAHRFQRSLGLSEDGFDAWRRAALWDAVRKTSFRQLTQREYGAALAHFIRLSGGEVKSERGLAGAIARRETTAEGDRRRAAKKLDDACAELAEAFGSAEQTKAYAAALLSQIHKATFASASAKQLIQTLFTLRNRAAKRLRAQKESTSRGGAETQS
jgi:hypothetical protein